MWGTMEKAKDDEMADDVMDEDKSFLTKTGLTQTLYFGFIVTVINIEHFIIRKNSNPGFS